MTDIDRDPEAERDPTGPRDPAPDLRLRGDPPRVMRLSRKALALMGAAACVGIGGALIYALQPQSRRASEELYNTDNRTTAETITSAPKDYGQVPQLGPPLPGDLGRPIVSAQGRGEAVPTPPIGTTAPPSAAETAKLQAQQRVQQERDSARTSGVFLGRQGATATAAGPASGTPSNPLLALSGLGGQPGQAQAAVPDQVSSRRAFLNGVTDRRTISSERLAPPASPYVVQAGTLISAALITGLRSDLPGQVTAQVTENVYDSPTGRILLIPQGSRLIGDYDDQVGFGQRRVLLAWTRLILPDGRSIVLEREPAGDAAGFAGLEDRVDEHWGALAKAAGLSTLLSFGAQLAADDSSSELIRALRDGGQNTLNQAGQEIVRRQLNVPPTLTVRPGFPVRILVSRDVVLEPWRGAR